MTIHAVAGTVAPLLILVSEAIYIRGIFVPNRKTGTKVRPSRSTFWILALLQGMLAASYYLAGGGLAAGLSAAYALMFLPIATLSIRYGYSKWERTDTVCLAGAIAVGGLWWYTSQVLRWEMGESAFLATILLLLTDFLGIYPTLKKVRAAPFTEERTAWLLTVIATAVNFLAVEEWGTVDLLYSPYLLLVNGIVTYYAWRPILFAKRPPIA